MIWEKWKYRRDNDPGVALVDVHGTLTMSNGKPCEIFMGGFRSFNDAGEFMLDCIRSDEDLKLGNVKYSATINLPALNPVHTRDKEGYGDSVTAWMRVPGTLSDDEAIALWNGLGYDDEHTWCQHSYDCCGRMYHGSLRIRTNGHSTLLQQHYGRNV